MKKSLIIGSVLIVTCLGVVDVEASYTEALREKYAGKNVYSEYEICVERQVIKKYTYGRTSNNVYLKYDTVSSQTPIINIDKAYDLNVIKDDKIYFINTLLREGKWANIGDFEQSKALFLKALNDTPDGIYYMNVMRDVVTSSKDRVSVKVVKTAKENVYGKLYDCEEVVVQRLSEFGRPTGDKMICKLYFNNGDIVYFSPLKYVTGDSPYSEQKNYSIEYKYGNGFFKVLQLTSSVKYENFDLINVCKLEKFPLGW